MPITARFDFGVLRLLDDPRRRLSPVDLGHAEALGVGHLLEQDLRARLLLAEVRRTAARDVLLDDVVAEHDADRLAVGEVLAEPERVGDAALALLVGVVQVLEPELAAVAEQPQEVARRCCRR